MSFFFLFIIFFDTIRKVIFMGKGINKSKVIEISKIKKEPDWMKDFRINSYNKFEQLQNPNFGPEL